MSACAGQSFAGDGVFDVDLTVVAVSGKVTINGAALTSTSLPELGFVERTSKSSAVVELDADGTYATRLAPGHYDVSYYGAADACQTVVAPCNSGPVELDVDLTKSGVLDVDVPSITVTGTVTANGATLADRDSGRGSIGFALGASAVYLDLGPTGAGTYAVALLPGTYDVTFDDNDPLSGCDGAHTPQLPCNGGRIKSGVVLSRSGVLDLDVPVVTITGAVTAKGAALVDSDSSRGTIGFVLGDRKLYLGLGQTGPGTYATSLFPGTYDVIFDDNDESDGCDGAHVPQLPCNGGPIKTGVPLTRSGVLDLDVPVVTLSGSVTANGAALADSDGVRGWVGFVLGSSRLYLSLGQTGPGTYAVSLLPGTYDVVFDDDGGESSGCDGAHTPQLPCNGGRIKSGVAVTTSGVLDLDVPVVTLAGTVKAKGATLADSDTGRGSIGFVLDGSSVYVDLGTTGPGAYALSLLPGTYAVVFSGNGCSGPTLPQLPCNSGSLDSAVQLAASGVLDLDVPAITVTGTVAIMETPLASTNAARGDIGFTSVGPGASSFFVPISSGTPATYRAVLLPGDYVVSYGADSACDATPSGSALPCDGEVVKGCDSP